MIKGIAGCILAFGFISCETATTRKTLHPRLDVSFDASDSTRRKIVIALVPYEDAEFHAPVDSSFKFTVSGWLKVSGRDTLLVDEAQSLEFKTSSRLVIWRLDPPFEFSDKPVHFIAEMLDITGHRLSDTLKYP